MPRSGGYHRVTQLYEVKSHAILGWVPRVGATAFWTETSYILIRMPQSFEEAIAARRDVTEAVRPGSVDHITTLADDNLVLVLGLLGALASQPQGPTAAAADELLFAYPCAQMWSTSQLRLPRAACLRGSACRSRSGSILCPNCGPNCHDVCSRASRARLPRLLGEKLPVPAHVSRAGGACACARMSSNGW